MAREDVEGMEGGGLEAEEGDGKAALGGPGSPQSQLPCMGKLREELTCSICLDICTRPVTTPCGHNFCRRCLRGALQYSMKCPKCREALPTGSGKHVNTVLWNTIQLLFPQMEDAPPSPATCRGSLDGNPRDSTSADRIVQQAEEALLNLFHTVRRPQAGTAQPAQGLDEFLSRLELSDPQDQLQVVSPHSVSGRRMNPTLGEGGIADDWGPPRTRSSLSPQPDQRRRSVASQILPVRGDAMQMLRNTVTRLESSFPRQPRSRTVSPALGDGRGVGGVAERLPFGDLSPEAFRVTPVEVTWAPHSSKPSSEGQEQGSQADGSIERARQRRRERVGDRRAATGMVNMALSDADAEVLTRHEASPQRMPVGLYHSDVADEAPEAPHLQRIEIAETAPSLDHSLEQFLELRRGMGIQAGAGLADGERSDDEYVFGPDGPPAQVYPYSDQLGSGAFVSTSSAPLDSASSAGAMEDEWLELRRSDVEAYHNLQNTSPSGSPVGSDPFPGAVSNGMGHGVAVDEGAQLRGPSFGLTRLAPELGMHLNNGRRSANYGVTLVPLSPSMAASDANRDFNEHGSSVELDDGQSSDGDIDSSSSDSSDDGYDVGENGVYEEFVVGDVFQGHRFSRGRALSPLGDYSNFHGDSDEEIADEEWQDSDEGEGVESDLCLDFETSPVSAGGYYTSGEFPTDPYANNSSSAEFASLDGPAQLAEEVVEDSPRSTPLPSNLCRIAVSLPQVDTTASAAFPYNSSPRGPGTDPTVSMPGMSTELHVVVSDLEQMASDTWEARAGMGQMGVPVAEQRLPPLRPPASRADDNGELEASSTNRSCRAEGGWGSSMERRGLRPGHRHVRGVASSRGRQHAHGTQVGGYIGMRYLLEDPAHELEQDGLAENAHMGCVARWRRCNSMPRQDVGAASHPLCCFHEGADRREAQVVAESSSSCPDRPSASGRRSVQELHGSSGRGRCVRNRRFEPVGDLEGSFGGDGYEGDPSEGEMVHPSGSGMESGVVHSDNELESLSASGRQSPLFVGGMRVMRLPNRINQFMSRLRRYPK